MRRMGLPEEVDFPVVPILDMAFQLLAFFIMTFQPPSTEARLDLIFPTAPAALPDQPAGAAGPEVESTTSPVGLETDLVLRAQADRDGRLASLRLAEADVADIAGLASLLRRYRQVAGEEPIRIALVADYGLRYDAVAQLIGACITAGVTTVRLAPPPGDRP